MATLITNRS